MTEEQLQQIKNGELWIENDIAVSTDKESREKLRKALQIVWPDDTWLPEGKPFYMSTTPYCWRSDTKNKENKPTIKASTLLEETISSSPIQLYPL